jgi:hypothetical protein
MNYGFWRKPTFWPYDSAHHTFLARAFIAIGKKHFGDLWSIENEDSEEDDYESYKHLDYPETADEKKIATITENIAKQLVAGHLVSALRRKPGGKLIPLKPHYWNTEHYIGRFYCCQMSLEQPYIQGNIESAPYWIYITTESLKTYLNSLPAPSVALTVAQETKCKHWLVKEMTDHTDPPQPKPAYRTIAKERFGVGHNAFDRSWRNAIAATGRENWTNPGRKKLKR